MKCVFLLVIVSSSIAATAAMGQHSTPLGRLKLAMIQGRTTPAEWQSRFGRVFSEVAEEGWFTTEVEGKVLVDPSWTSDLQWVVTKLPSRSTGDPVDIERAKVLILRGLASLSAPRELKRVRNWDEEMEMAQRLRHVEAFRMVLQATLRDRSHDSKAAHHLAVLKRRIDQITLAAEARDRKRVARYYGSFLGEAKRVCNYLDRLMP